MRVIKKDDPRRMWLNSFLNILLPVMVELNADLGDSKELPMRKRTQAWSFRNVMEALGILSAETLAAHSSDSADNKMPFVPSRKTWHAIYVMIKRSRSRFPVSFACCLHAQTLDSLHRREHEGRGLLQVDELDDVHWGEILDHVETRYIAPDSKLPSKALSTLVGQTYATAVPWDIVSQEYTSY